MTVKCSITQWLKENRSFKLVLSMASNTDEILILASKIISCESSNICHKCRQIFKISLKQIFKFEVRGSFCLKLSIVALATVQRLSDAKFANYTKRVISKRSVTEPSPSCVVYTNNFSAQVSYLKAKVIESTANSTFLKYRISWKYLLFCRSRRIVFTLSGTFFDFIAIFFVRGELTKKFLPDIVT